MIAQIVWFIEKKNLNCTKSNCWNFINVQKVGLTSLKTSHPVLHKGQTLDSFHPFISLRENERVGVNAEERREWKDEKEGFEALANVLMRVAALLWMWNSVFHAFPFFLSRPWQVISWWERAIEGRLLIESGRQRWRERELVSCEENIEVWGKIWEWRRQLDRK